MKKLLTIRQNERTLETDNYYPACVSTGGNSAELVFEDSYFDGYIIGVTCAIDRNTVIDLEYNSDTRIITLPYSVFAESGYKYFALYGIKGEETITTELLEVCIKNSNSLDTADAFQPPNWKVLAMQLWNEYYKDNIELPLKELIEEAKSQQIKVAEQQTALDNKFNELNTLENTVNENETNRQTNEIKRQNDTAKAIKSCNDKVTEINTKLLNGDFVGATGATPNITIGNVTLGNPNVTIRGIPEAPVLDFTMPSAGNLSYATDADIDEMIIEVFG